MAGSVLLGTIAVLTVVGVALTYLGFELAEPLLQLAGLAGGGAAGAVVGFAVLPRFLAGVVTVEQRVVLGVVLLVLGALLGVVFVPALGRLATGLAGFVATAAATGIVLTGQPVAEAVLSAVPDEPLRADPAAVAAEVADAPVFATPSFQRAFAVALVVGLVGGGLALVYYTDIVSLALTAAGATVLGAVIPVWLDVLVREGAPTATLSEFSWLWFAVALATGLGFQFRRHSEELDPRSGDFVLDRDDEGPGA